MTLQDLFTTELTEATKQYPELNKITWKVRWSKHTKSLGECRVKHATGQATISIASNYFRGLDGQIKANTSIVHTIRHEIAHALEYIQMGRLSHSRYWYNLAESLGCDLNIWYDGTKLRYTLDRYKTPRDKTCYINRPWIQKAA